MLVVKQAFDAANADNLPPDKLAQLGAAAAVYSGNGLPSQQWFDDCDRLGVPILGIQESWATRAQEGYNAGVDDANFAVYRFGLRGRGRDFPIAFAASDENAYSPSSNGNKIADYAQGNCVTIPNPVGWYGNRYAVDAALGGAHRVTNARLICVNGGWVPSTWFPDYNRDFMVQEANLASPLFGTDINTVLIDIFGDDMFTDDDRNLLIEIKGALKSLNFGDNAGADGSMQTQTGQLWANIIGTDGDLLLKRIDAIVAQHVSEGGSSSDGPSAAQVEALKALKGLAPAVQQIGEVLAKVDAAFPG